MDRIELIWSAEVIISRGEIDGLLCITSEAAATVTNETEPASVIRAELEHSALGFIADITNTDQNCIDIVSFSWSEMAYVDAGELPPPPP